MVNGQATQRSTLDAKHIVQRLQQRGVEQLSQDEEVWAIVDPSELRKPYAQEMPDLMPVRSLEGERTVPGYRTLNVLGVGRGGRRGILYHKLFSSTEKGFESESSEIEAGIQSVGEALAEKRGHITYVFDRQFDNIAIWGSIWEQGNHLLGRIQHRNRKVSEPSGDGNDGWREVSVEKALRQAKELARISTRMLVRKTGQSHAKLQEVTALLSSCPVRVEYQAGLRGLTPGEKRKKEVWLVLVKLEDVSGEPWVLLTDWPVTDAESATRAFMMYRTRWAIEDAFKFTKEMLGWEQVQLLNLEGIRTLVALAWVAAGFLYELGVSLDWSEIELLARLGAWEPRKDRPPGKIILTRGLQRMLDYLATRAFLLDEIRRNGRLPPRIAALLGDIPLSEL